eukprot:1147357-Pelagomonas_calceolata.AAC.9
MFKALKDLVRGVTKVLRLGNVVRSGRVERGEWITRNQEASGNQKQTHRRGNANTSMQEKETNRL